MKMIILLLVLIVAPSYANDDLEQPATPTNTEVQKHNKTFIKIRYILGAAFSLHSEKIINDFNNVKFTDNDWAELISKMEKIKRDIKLIESESTLSIDEKIILAETNICMSGISNLDNCQQALVFSKDYLWGETFGTDWSNYPPLTPWDGFPDSMK